LTLSPNAQSAGELRRTAGYDRQSTKDPKAVLCFEMMLQKIPKIPADTEPTSHQFILMDWIRDIAATAFPKSVPAPRNPYITREIVLQIRERNKHSSIKSWHNSCIEDSVVRAAFRFWAKK
jgi:hypothetical protein